MYNLYRIYFAFDNPTVAYSNFQFCLVKMVLTILHYYSTQWSKDTTGKMKLTAQLVSFSIVLMFSEKPDGIKLHVLRVTSF